MPSQVSRHTYQEELYDFLGNLRYRRLGWRRDKGIRDTGPYLNGQYYGTHPAVRVYYSPEVIDWLIGGRQGGIPDGAIIIKEMYPPPAARYDGVAERDLPKPNWTVMTRDRAGSVDGWFWSYFDSNPTGADPPIPQAPDSHEFPFRYPDSDFGSYCVRCHVSAESELTFATTENIEGFDGEPIEYEVDDSWKTDDDPGPDPHPNFRAALQTTAPPPEDFINHGWLALYDQFPMADASTIEHIPPVSHDRVVADGNRQFVTSDQCKSCHSGDTSPFGPNMIADGLDLSPFGEWRWSMMGLAGRDPIFYAQLETETTLHRKQGGAFTSDGIENFCLRCHGVMGQRQFTHDHPGELFTARGAFTHAEDDPARVYGALARDGVSCTVCHRAADDSALPLTEIQTGNFRVAPAEDGVLPIFGGFEDPVERPMLESLAMRPVESSHMRSSRLCASCHTVFLPVLDEDGRAVDARYEQATILEWVNSDYRDGGRLAQSCQDCHMPDTADGQPLRFKIANIQDHEFPSTSFLAPLRDITVDPREQYRRHQLQGANLYALEFFRRFPAVLGVRHKSFMTGSDTALADAIEGTREFVGTSGTVEILDSERAGDEITTTVKISNLTGHRLPSGVGFRRMVLELLIVDSDGQTRWGSGRMNSLGVVVDETGTPLLSEFSSVEPSTGEQAYQPHHQVVDSQDQAQIYEELTKDTRGQFTTSFLALAETVKDNRLLPSGWTDEGPAGFTPEFAEATRPHGEAAHDADFIDGTGSDMVTYVANVPNSGNPPLQVRATLYYQSIPPRYLKDRFTQASGPATRRLHYLGSRLDDSTTPFPGWKFAVAADTRAVN
jgi:hypothetical protein